MTTLGFSETEAAQMIAPLFAELLSKALESEASIGPVFQRMISWVESLGIEIADVIGEAFKQTRKELDGLFWSLRGAREQMAKLREDRKEARRDIAAAQQALLDLVWPSEDKIAAIYEGYAKVLEKKAKDLSAEEKDRALRQWFDRSSLKYYKTIPKDAIDPVTGLQIGRHRGPSKQLVTGEEAYTAVLDAISAATHGLTKAGKEKKYDIITAKEQRAILADVEGAANKLMVQQLIQAENTALNTKYALERQKEQIQLLRDNRTALRESRGKLELIKNRGGEIVDRLGPGGPIASGLRDVVMAIKAIPGEQHGGYIPKSGLAYLHAGETVIPAGGGLPNLRATINIGGVSFKDIIVKTIEDTAYSRQSTLVSPAIQTRGA